ncbi:MAG: CBS domain-containing protein [Bacteroidetes bacterium]|nr:MAG: CBS domain-containing protein [Bacteroidota bacterium]
MCRVPPSDFSPRRTGQGPARTGTAPLHHSLFASNAAIRPAFGPCSPAFFSVAAVPGRSRPGAVPRSGGMDRFLTYGGMDFPGSARHDDPAGRGPTGRKSCAPPRGPRPQRGGAPMTVRRLITRSIPALPPNASIEDALECCLAHRLPYLPVVQTHTLVGLVSEECLLDAPDEHAPVASLCTGRPLTIPPDLHPFEAARLMAEARLPLLPVVDDDRYEGLVLQTDLFTVFTALLATQEPGAILVIEMAPHDLSMSHLAYIFESQGVRIRSIASEAPGRLDGPIRLTVKLNVTDTARLRHVLEHHGYRVTAYYNEDMTDEELDFRVAAFLHYLEV